LHLIKYIAIRKVSALNPLLLLYLTVVANLRSFFANHFDCIHVPSVGLLWDKCNFVDVVKRWFVGGIDGSSIGVSIFSFRQIYV
jgi:hypothetical protein